MATRELTRPVLDPFPEQVKLCRPGKVGAGGERGWWKSVTEVQWGYFWVGEGNPGGSSGPGEGESCSSPGQILDPGLTALHGLLGFAPMRQQVHLSRSILLAGRQRGVREIKFSYSKLCSSPVLPCAGWLPVPAPVRIAPLISLRPFHPFNWFHSWQMRA